MTLVRNEAVYKLKNELVARKYAGRLKHKV